MIYTITLNPAIDRTIYLNQLNYEGISKITETTIDAAGKGINVAKVIHSFGMDVLCLGFVGGVNGDLLISKLNQEGIRHDFIHIDGNTRENIKICENELSRVLELNEVGPLIKKEDIDSLLIMLGRKLKPEDYVIISGSIPQGVSQNIYEEILSICNDKKIKTILDATGDAFRFGLKSCPTIVKPNKIELEDLFGQKFKSNQDILNAGKKLIDKGIEEILISLGKEGSIYVSNRESYRILVPSVLVRSSVGAGDALVAGYVVGLIKKLSITDRLVFANSVATASVMTEGTKAGSLQDIEKIQKKIVIELL